MHFINYTVEAALEGGICLRTSKYQNTMSLLDEIKDGDISHKRPLYI